ncbi:hypothetical protein NDN08_000158 [Rhodosorus marinus]|uniref:SANTA domain-containing protein n=1 Tax=Rhodosorus marinus TaxID=101924 RepID=A0AAV8UED4_9RHOD|nr:hypothetical protein NDN08_000158 [Rhodosorus marinus]
MEEERDDEKVYLREWYVFLRYNRDRVKVLVRGRREVERGVLDQEPWQSSPIVRRLSPREVITKRGSCYVLVGPCDEKAAKASGVSSEVMELFRQGFNDGWKRIVMDMAFSWKQESTDTREKPAAQVTKTVTTAVPKLPNTLEFVEQDHDEMFSQPVPTSSPVISEPFTPRTREVGCEAQPHQIVNIADHLDILNRPEHADGSPPTPEVKCLSTVPAGIEEPVPDTRARKEGLAHPLESQPLNAEDVTNSMSKTNGVSGKGSSANSRRSSQISKKDADASRNENETLKLKVHDSANSSYSAPTYVALDDNGLITDDQAPGVEINSMPLTAKSPARDGGSSTQDDDEEVKAVDALSVGVAIAEVSKERASNGPVLVPMVAGAASRGRKRVSQIAPVLEVETGTNSAASGSAKTGPTGVMTREQDIEPRAKLRPRRGRNRTQLLVSPEAATGINPAGSYSRKTLATGNRGDQSVDNATETSTSVGKGSGGKHSSRKDGSPGIEGVSRKRTLLPSSSHQSTVEIEEGLTHAMSVEDNKNIREVLDNADTPGEQKRTADALPTPPKLAVVDKISFKPSEGTSSVKTQDSKISMQKVKSAPRESPPKRSRRSGNRELERLRTRIDYSVYYLPGPRNHRRESLRAGNACIDNAPSSEAHAKLSKGSELSSGGVSRSRKRSDRKMCTEETLPQKQESELISDSSLLKRAGVRTSRSGRVIMPVLEYWRNQTVRRGVLGIEDIEDPSNEMLSAKKRRYSEVKVRRKLFHDSNDEGESPLVNGQDRKDAKPAEQGNEKHKTNLKRRQRQTIG